MANTAHWEARNNQLAKKTQAFHGLFQFNLKKLNLR